MATTKTLTPTNQAITLAAFTEKPDNRTNVTNDDKLADAVNALNSNCVKCAKLETTITINYEDGLTIGHRTTDSTKVIIKYLSGYPTGKTILGAVAYPTTDIYGAILWVDSAGSLRGVSKQAVTDYAVTILVFYKEP